MLYWRKKLVSNAWKQLHETVEDARCQSYQFCSRVRAYNYLFKADLCEVFPAFLIKLQNTTKALLRECDLGIKNCFILNFSVVDEMFQFFEADLRYIGKDLNPPN